MHQEPSEYQRYLIHRAVCVQTIWNHGHGTIAERICRANAHHRDLYVECGASTKFAFTDDDWEQYFRALRNGC